MLKNYAAAVIGAGALAAAAAAAFGGSAGDPLFLLALVALGAASERFKVSLFGASHVSLSVVVCMAAYLAGGTRDAVLVAVALGLAANLGGSVGLHKTLFNASTYVLSTLAFVGAVQVWGVALPLGWPEVIGAATVGALADFVVNAGLVAVAIALSGESSLRGVVREKFFWLIPHYLPAGALAAALAIGYAMAGLWTVPLLASALLGLQFTLRQYSAVQTQYALEMQSFEERLAVTQAELRRLQRQAA